jgi:hypothetical protein
VSGDVPAVDLAQPEIDVGDQRSIFTLGHVKQFDCIFVVSNPPSARFSSTQVKDISMAARSDVNRAYRSGLGLFPGSI